MTHGRGPRVRKALLGGCAWSLLGLLPGCGGGGGSGDSSQPVPAVAASVAGGALVYMTGSELRHLDLASGQQRATPTDLSASFNKLGYGAGQFTLLLNPPLSASGQFSTVWQRWTPQGFERTAGLAYPLQARLHGGSNISSRVQPSPDGARISFSSTEFEALGATPRNYLYVVEAGTGDAFTLAGYTDAVWVDAQSLVGVKEEGLFRVLWQPGGLQETRIAGVDPAAAGAAPHAPSLSPDGRSVAFVQDGAVWRIGIDGQGLSQLTARRATPPTWPTWSPDGQHLAVVERACRSSTGFDFPPVHRISATQALQVLDDAPVIKDQSGSPAWSCAPVYWIPA